jgi:hypothetical protein
MKVGLAVFMVVVFLAQNTGTGIFEAKDFVYKKLNGTEVQYFLNNLNTLPDPSGSATDSSDELAQGINIEALSAQIHAHIKNAVEPILLQEVIRDASIFKTNSPSFAAHQSSTNVLMFSILLGLLAGLFITRFELISKSTESSKLKQLIASVSPRSPNKII